MHFFTKATREFNPCLCHFFIFSKSDKWDLNFFQKYDKWDLDFFQHFKHFSDIFLQGNLFLLYKKNFFDNNNKK